MTPLTRRFTPCSTLKAIEYAFGIGRPGVPFDFHRVINIASTSYPLKSNKEIREKLNSHPLDVNFVEVRPSPNRPNPKNWHKFVECDDKVHRIYRMNIPKTIPMFVGSQWFVITREFAEYMVDGSSEFVTDYKAYCKHVVVADENFFATVLKNSPFCDKHANDNLLHMQFDDWENNRKKKEEVRSDEERRNARAKRQQNTAHHYNCKPHPRSLRSSQLDPSKCLMPDPEHCGRSPTTMTYDYLPVLELSDGLFARKFSVDVDAEILDIIDRKRLSEDSAPKKLFPDGENVIFVKKDTIDGGSAMCLSRSANGKEVMYAECFEKGASKLEDNWEKVRAVVKDVLYSCPRQLASLAAAHTLTHTTRRFAHGRCFAPRPHRNSFLHPCKFRHSQNGVSALVQLMVALVSTPGHAWRLEKV